MKEFFNMFHGEANHMVATFIQHTVQAPDSFLTILIRKYFNMCKKSILI